MELYFFRPAEYEKLYNCNIYSIDQVPLESRQHVVAGTIFMVLATIFISLYIPCLIALGKRLEQSCYKFLFFIGIVDVICLPICGLTTGYMAIVGAVFCSYPTFFFLQLIAMTDYEFSGSSDNEQSDAESEYDDDVSDFEDDDSPLPDLQSACRRERYESTAGTWTADPPPRVETFTPYNPFPEQPKNPDSESDLFGCFISVRIIKIIVKHINEEFDVLKKKFEREGSGKPPPLDPTNENEMKAVFEKFMANCNENYKPGEFVTVDETLVGFRGRCIFRMFIPSKAAKFGIKFWTCVDSHTKYLHNETAQDCQKCGRHVCLNDANQVVYCKDCKSTSPARKASAPLRHKI